jgi:uncharacterized membrane protein YedE/YeeE
VRNLFVLLGGLSFGFGLAWSGMAKPEVVLSFLHLEDLGLLLVMGGAVGVTMLAYQVGPRALGRALCGAFDRSTATLSARTWLGAALFGLGWAVSGLCPGAALASLGIGNVEVLWGLGAMFLGAYAQARWFPELRSDAE